MQQYTILLPTTNITEHKTEQIIHGITEIFGGITVIKNTYGLWVNINGAGIIKDKHIMLIINTDKEAWIRTLKTKLEIELNEDWIYITKQKVTVIK